MEDENEQEETSSDNSTTNPLEYTSEVVENDVYSQIDQSTIPPLPDAVISPRVDFKWHSDLEIDSKTFIMNVNQAYSEIVHWRQNMFMLPSGKDGQAFVFELA